MTGSNRTVTGLMYDLLVWQLWKAPEASLWKPPFMSNGSTEPEAITMPMEIITRCGFRCDLCLAYQPNIWEDDRRAELSDGWERYFGFRIPAERIACPGCLTGGPSGEHLLDRNCPVRPCVINLGLEHCGQCDDYACERLSDRLISKDAMLERHPGLPRHDYHFFIRPYENLPWLTRYREERPAYQRMGNVHLLPDREAMERFIGPENGHRWRDLLAGLDELDSFASEVEYGGRDQGWGLKYHRGGTTLVALFPERKAFTVLVVLGARELDQLDREVGLSETRRYHDGAWIWLRVADDRTAADAQILIDLKRQSRWRGQATRPTTRHP